MARESMQYDVVVVGGGPAGLAGAIRLKQLAAQNAVELGVCVIEKGAEIGAHILSGAVMDPRALEELFPEWKALGAPLNTPVSEDRFLFLTRSRSFKVPGFLLPECFRNHGNHVVSLGNVCRWLAKQAESLGVEIYPGFAAAEVLYDGSGAVKGVATGDMGVGRDGKPTDKYQPGIELHGKYTFFAEGCRGHLGRLLMERYRLNASSDPQVYGIGLKELWEIQPKKHRAGLVIHSAGWPLDADTYGGSFLYHMEDNLVSVGFVVGLAYANPYLDPYEEFQRYKTHPDIRGFFEGGKRIAYGARAISAGGLMSLPKLTFAGGWIRRRARRLRRRVPRLVALRRALPRAQFQAVDVEGPLLGHADGRRGANPARREIPLDAASRPRGPRMSPARIGVQAHRLSETRRQAHLRPSLFGVHLQYEPRGKPALPPHAERRERPGRSQSGEVRRPRKPLLSRGRVRIRQGRRRHRPAPDQRAELRSLQDLRHQGSDAEHCLGHAA